MDYSELDIEELLYDIDIVKLISEDVVLERINNYYIGKCPFENSSNENFIVDPNKKTFFCLDCGKSGNAISYLVEKNNISIHEAIKKLSSITGTFVCKNKFKHKNIIKEKSSLHSIFSYSMNYYISLLKENNNLASKYIEKRQISNEMVKKFKLGYSGPFGDGLYNYLISNGFSHEEIIKSGMFGEKNETNGTIFYDKFYNRLMFPIFDKKGLIIGFGGRTLGSSSAKYLNSSETILFDKGSNLYGLQIAGKSRKNYFIVCEGNVDVIMLHQYGYETSVASLGTALTKTHVDLLASYNKEIYLCYDNDPAGKKAIYKALKLFNEKDISTKIIDLSPYKDPDDFLKNMGKEEFQKRINNSLNCNEYLINYIKSLDTIDTQDEYYNVIIEYLSAL